jgi:hypothetical protein
MTAETRRGFMRIRPTPWVVLGLVLASALFFRTDCPALADTATVYPQDGLPIPFHGLRPCGVTLTASIDASQTSVPISDPARLKVGQIVETQDTSKEIMEVTGLGTSTMEVNRHALGTSAASHNSGTALYSDFTAVKVMASGVGYRPTGATLSAALDTGTLENSGAFLAQSIGKTETTINITDATLLTDATVVRIDGTAYVSVTNKNFLGSTGRSVTCPWNTPAGDGITFACSTLGPTPDGPTGSGILAAVRLRAEHLGPVSLDLENVKLTDIQANLLSVGQVLGASATVVSGSPSPPSPPTPNCGGTGLKVCILPSSQDVGLGNEFTAYVVVQNVTKQFGYGLGGYQFTLKWTPATEEMSVLSVHRGYLTDGGSPWYRNAILTAPISEADTILPLSGVSQLQPGYTARLDPDTGEEMLITAVSAVPTPSMTVIRGYHGTTPTAHGLNAAVFAGPERMKVTRASLPAPHSAGADFRDNLRVLRVSNQSLLTASALQIDSERFKVIEKPARTLRDTGLTLASGVDASAISLSVSGTGAVEKGWVLQVESELMPVTGVGSGTVQVARGFFGSQATSHSAGTSLKAVFPETNTVRTSRAFQGTSIASHDAGAPITDVDGLGGYAFTLGSTAAPSVIDFAWADNSTFLGQTGRTVQCNQPGFGSGNVSFQCNTTGALPLGPTGSGTLATVNVTAKQLLPNAPFQALNLSGVALHDISGDDLPVTTAAGGVRVLTCPDFNHNRSVGFTDDVMDVAQEALIRPPPHPSKYDVDQNGNVDFVGDVMYTAQVTFMTEPQPLRCPP